MDDLTTEQTIDLAINFANPHAEAAQGWTSSVTEKNGTTTILINLGECRLDKSPITSAVPSILKRFNDAAIISNYSGQMLLDLLESKRQFLKLSENITVTRSEFHVNQLFVKTNLSPEQLKQILRLTPPASMQTEYNETVGMLDFIYKRNRLEAEALEYIPG